MAHTELYEHRKDGLREMDFCFATPSLEILANAVTTEMIKHSINGNLVGLLGKEYRGLEAFSQLCVYYLGYETMEESY